MSTSIDPTVPDAQVSLLGRDDTQTVDAHGRPAAARGIEGVELRQVRSHIDQRGSLSEVINFSDPFWREPIVYSYSITVNPGRIKGWGMHLRQVDRHYVHCGLVRLVLFDARQDSPTHGNIQQISLGDEARGAVRIPTGVWHAVQAFGTQPAHITNFPTIPYDHANPDKQILPIDTELIPFRFDDLDDYGR